MNKSETDLQGLNKTKQTECKSKAELQAVVEKDKRENIGSFTTSKTVSLT